jgi:DNA-directed RNA polymerase subunit M/transcription elongation factor TFIIS
MPPAWRTCWSPAVSLDFGPAPPDRRSWSMAEILTCGTCGHSRRITSETLARWNIRTDSMSTVDVRTVLSKKSEKLKCRACGARHPKIATISETKKKQRVHEGRSKVTVQKLLLSCSNWLYGREQELLRSFSSQLESGHELSSRQLAVLGRIERRALARQAPRFVDGGGPGTGRRR